MSVVKELKHRRRNIYLMLEDLDFAWDENDLQEFREMWERDFPLPLIAEHFGRDPDEVALLVMDQRRKEMIRPRPGGIFGKGGPHVL